MKHLTFRFIVFVALLCCIVPVNARTITFADWTSTNHGNSTTSFEEFTFTTVGTADLSFDWQVSSESNYDWLVVLLDGVEILKKSGSLSGSYVYSSAQGENLAQGDHLLVVKYTKDGSQSHGNDLANVSNIVVTVEENSHTQKTFPDWTSTNHNHSSISSEEYTFTTLGTADLSFDWEVSSENNYDWLVVLLDGVEILKKSGSLSGSYVYSSALGNRITQGAHTLVVKYTKDGSSNVGDDQAKVYNIVVSITESSHTLIDGVYYSPLANNTASVIGIVDTVRVTIRDVVSFDEVEYSVTTIGAHAFSGYTRLESITIPSGITSIRDYAFDNCTGLKEVIIEDGDNTLSLGYNGASQGLFYDSPLESVYLGRNLSYSSSSSYGYSPFYNKDAIRSLTIGDSVTTIGSYAFYSCENLTTIAIPASMASIENYAFQNCNNLSFVLNSSSLDVVKGSSGNGYIGYYASQVVRVDTIIDDYYFYTASDGTHYLSYYSGQDSVLVLPEAYNGENYSIGDYAFYNRSSLDSIFISSSVTSIGNYAFSGCSSISSIEIPASVNSIGNGTFDNCTCLKEVIIENSDNTLALDRKSTR